MSVVYSNDHGWIISHLQFINKLYETDLRLKAKDAMFEVNTPYMKDAEALKTFNLNSNCSNNDCNKKVIGKKRKRLSSAVGDCDGSNGSPFRSSQRSEVEMLEKCCTLLVSEAKRFGHFQFVASNDDIKNNNKRCRAFAAQVFQCSTLLGKGSHAFFAGNASEHPTVAVIENQNYILPQNSIFFCKDVSFLSPDAFSNYPITGFDLVIVDPPWWNKYIRRRKKVKNADGYAMMRTEDLMQIKVKSVLAKESLIAVWCTNNESHIEALREKIFPAWGVNYIATWFWLKVDRSGTPICNFSTPPGKQPYERILFARSNTYLKANGPKITDPIDGKIIISVPSAIHSHKPPLLDILQPYVVPSPHSLELFARSLLPGTASWGLEVLKLQHEHLFTAATTNGEEGKEPDRKSSAQEELVESASGM